MIHRTNHRRSIHHKFKNDESVTQGRLKEYALLYVKYQVCIDNITNLQRSLDYEETKLMACLRELNDFKKSV